jgi:probable phosphoglycerate mutase
MTTFFLIRHASCSGLGRTLWGRTPGVCLNEQGKLQAQQLAERFQGITLQAIYSSPLERAVETAETIARTMNIEVRKNPAFDEIHLASGQVSRSTRSPATKTGGSSTANAAPLRSRAESRF